MTRGDRVTRMPEVVHVAASGIVYNDRGEILLEKRADNGWWGLPGGHIDVGESVEQAAVREIWEETGIRARVRRLVGIYSDPQYNVIGVYSDILIHFVVLIFECEYLSGDLRVSEESTDIGVLPGTKSACQDVALRRAGHNRRLGKSDSAFRQIRRINYGIRASSTIY